MSPNQLFDSVATVESAPQAPLVVQTAALISNEGISTIEASTEGFVEPSREGISMISMIEGM